MTLKEYSSADTGCVLLPQKIPIFFGDPEWRLVAYTKVRAYAAFMPVARLRRDYSFKATEGGFILSYDKSKDSYKKPKFLLR